MIARLLKLGGALALPAVLVACGGRSDEEAEHADAARNYVPPQVTSRLDFGSMVQHRFERLDRNADGAITKDELPGDRPERITRLDRNGDGRVTAQEFSEGAMERFDRYDINKDGTVTSDEYRAGGGGRH